MRVVGSHAWATSFPATARAKGRMSAAATGYSVPSAATTPSVSEFHDSAATLYSHSAPLRPSASNAAKCAVMRLAAVVRSWLTPNSPTHTGTFHAAPSFDQVDSPASMASTFGASG